MRSSSLLAQRRRIASLFQPKQFFSNQEIGDTVLSFKNVSFEYRASKPLLENVSFNVREGAKVTIMGQNGSGKSTILRLMNGLLTPTAGGIHIKNNFALSRALQVVPIEERSKTVRDFFIARLHGVSSGVDSRIMKVLQTVELEGIDLNREMKSFSGGQQARLLLASSLILEPDVLLLDEPTNNLDKRGIEMLSSVISNTEKTCVVISHDEDFLNSFTDAVLYVDTHQRKVEYYEGNYNDVKREITARMERENAQNARLLKDIEKKKQQAQAFANKGGSSVRNAAKKLKENVAELQNKKIVVRKEDKTLLDFQIPSQDLPGVISAKKQPQGEVKAPLTISHITIPMTGVHLDYTMAPLQITKGSHVRLKGPNGVGKTTLLESIVHQRAEGIEINPQAIIGYYRQDFHNLDHEATVYQSLLLAAAKKGHEEQYIRRLAAQFFLSKDFMNQEVSTLSEGQKGLLSLCCLVLTEPGLLIMDEPTNHINFRHLPVIAQALNNYEGTLVIVSHDEDFVRQLNLDMEIDLSKPVGENTVSYKKKVARKAMM